MCWTRGSPADSPIPRQEYRAALQCSARPPQAAARESRQRAVRQVGLGPPLPVPRPLLGEEQEQREMTANTTESGLVGLPPEILDLVLSFLDPYDLLSFGLVCKYAATLISPSHPTVWRHAFLHLWDDPKLAWSALLPSARAENGATEAAWDWHSKVRDRCAALKVLTTANKDYRRENLALATDALVDIIDTAYTRPWAASPSGEGPVHGQRRQSRSISTLEETFLKFREAEHTIHDYDAHPSSPPYVPAVLPPLRGRPVTRSMSSSRKPVSENESRLHIYFGLTSRERRSDYSQGQARCIVYNWHRTSAECDYGPFKDIKSGQWGHVNWQSLEAVSSLISRHMELLVGDQMSFPQGFRYALPYQLPINPECPEDWAGVTGAWVGTYAFLDWTVLNQFNNHHWQNRDRPVLDSHDEARGDLMHLDLHLDESLKTDVRLATKIPVSEDLPMLYFSGTSRGAGTNRPYISVRGTASLVPGARQVRWRFFIRYGGADQWQLEGVQAGGIRSGGVYGLWTHCDHDEQGPIGPFCYFPEQLCEKRGAFCELNARRIVPRTIVVP